MRTVSNHTWCTAGAVLCLLLVSGEAAAEICLDVDLTFAGGSLSSVSVQSMQSEASAIWEPYGVHIQWLPARDANRCPRAHGSFDVLIEDQPSSAGTASRIVLGSTHVLPARIDRVPVFVDYDETEQVLKSLLVLELFTLIGSPETGPADMGRALGRVLAHEIGHVVLAEPRHQRRGLMRRWFSPADLVRRQRWTFALSRREIERLRQREQVLETFVPSAPV